MVRRNRLDGPGVWHHLMTRSIARRTMFESRLDMRMFLSLLAREVRGGRIEVHAWTVLPTHFHLLARSIAGEVSRVMRNVLNRYVKWFNRGRRRDGPLVRGRFQSRVVDSIAYRLQLVRYIDFNPVEARLVASPLLYRFGSARYHAGERCPRWISRGWIESVLSSSPQRVEDHVATYNAVFGEAPSPGMRRMIRRRLDTPARAADPLDDLLMAGAPAVLDWMRRKARLADGQSIGMPVCDPIDLDARVRKAQVRLGAWEYAQSRRNYDAWPIARVGLLRDLSAATQGEIAVRTKLSLSATLRSERKHRELMRTDEEYARRIAEIGATALQACYNAGVRRSRGEV